jgi:hypothetical protein
MRCNSVLSHLWFVILVACVFAPIPTADSTVARRKHGASSLPTPAAGGCIVTPTPNSCTPSYFRELGAQARACSASGCAVAAHAWVRRRRRELLLQTLDGALPVKFGAHSSSSVGRASRLRMHIFTAPHHISSLSEPRIRTSRVLLSVVLRCEYNSAVRIAASRHRHCGRKPRPSGER